MVLPAIVWRNPKSVNRRRLWNCARRDEMSSLYVVVRSGERASVWEGLPNLKLLEGQCSEREANREFARSLKQVGRSAANIDTAGRATPQ